MDKPHCRFLQSRLITAGALLLVCYTSVLQAANANTEEEAPVELTISAAVLYDKIYGAWLGQLAGNIYGLPHENLYVEEPGPDAFPYGYDYRDIPFYPQHFGSGSMTGVMRAMGGAFSDDDTDIEYVYLNLMEKHGIEPTYAQIKAAWLHHVRNWVWIANRAALGLMAYGYSPPETGSKHNNAHWFQIDPQLVNEIWAVTAPGMVDYAAAKSAWGARISNDGWGIEPTIHYGAMYAAAFFESDIARLIDIGTAALPEGSRFTKTVEDMKRLYAAHPTDWRAARQAMAHKYYHQAEYKTIWNANLNGAAAILALLYGQGDIQRTLDLACAMGFDADNQAATLIGLLGVVHGRSGIPDDLLMPIEGWSEPFNDRYVNRSRFGLPSDSLKNIAARSVAQAEAVIMANGGKKTEVNGAVRYTVNATADFTPPLELASEPVQHLNMTDKVNRTYYAGGRAPVWRIVDGALPPGLQFDSGRLSGSPTEPGVYAVRVMAEDAGQQVEQTFAFHVHGKNLALSAEHVIAPDVEEGTDTILLRDGQKMAAENVRTVPTSDASVVSFGYEWDTQKNINTLVIVGGNMSNDGGWFTSMTADYLSVSGEWLPVPGLRIEPEPDLGNSEFYHPPYATYALTFDVVTTTSMRLRGLSGGSGGLRYVSLSEFAVYGPE